MYNYEIHDIHTLLMEQTEDEKLEGSGFGFQNVTEVRIEFHRTRDISASSYIELPKKYKTSKSINHIQKDDSFYFL